MNGMEKILFPRRPTLGCRQQLYLAIDQAFSKKEESWLIDTTISQSRPGRRGGLQSTAKRSSSGDQNRQPCELGTGRDDCQELEFGDEAVQNLGQQLGILSHLWDFC